MNIEKLAAPFPSASIEWRVQSCGTKQGGEPWARVLAYVTARAIMTRLDEICGLTGWKVSYRFVREKGVICELSIWDDDKNEWITKEDGAEETDIESMKGGISSALKRAGACFGIGRYLYQLDAGFADCSKDARHHPHWAKTKDGTAFSWAAPELPPWALPAETSHEPIESPLNLGGPALERDAASAKSKKGPRVTQAQLKKLHALRREMDLNDDVFKAELFRSYHVRTTKELDRDSAGELISRLETKKKASLERDVQDTFGDGGKVATLQAMARGHIEKIKVLGEKYQNGDPIVYKNEGIPVENLGELEEIVAAMGDEGELERLIIRLEALLSTISF